MRFDSEEFAKRYATKYTLVLGVLLLVPLLFYLYMQLQIDRAKVRLSLEKQVEKIVFAMDSYSNEEQVFHFPRYKTFDATLYDNRCEVIFSTFLDNNSTMPFNLSSCSEGFYNQKGHFFYIYRLPEGVYFGATYLLVAKEHKANDVYMFAMLGILTLLITLFALSLRILKNFSHPFREINSRLDNFIKDSMHEINTPLSIININVDLFANKYGENRYLQRIKSASKTLATIYDDMDYLIKQGRVKHKIQKIDFSEFLQRRVDYFRGIANLKNLRVVTKIEEGIFYEFSKTKLQRIVDNTISNAIKYSNDDDEVIVKLFKKDEKIIFLVEDHGIGIDNLKKIFSRYYRENHSRGGFGIGLNIVKDIIDEEKIELNVESEVGKGSLFIYTFPKQKYKNK